MADTEFAALIARLADRTTEGKVNWKTTTRDDEFVIVFQRLSLSMRRGSDDENDEFVVFTLRNAAGKKIDEFWVWENNDMWATAEQLWSRGRRRALKIDEAIDGLLAELDKDGAIGEDPASALDDDDDLPF